MLGFLWGNLKRLVAFIIVLVLLICSLTYFGKKYTDPQTFSKTISSIDEKKVTVLGVSAAIAGSATLLASIPDDSTTPLAEEMMNLSSYLALIVCILVLEKSLLTVFGAVSFYGLIPLMCVLLLTFIIRNNKKLLSWAIKIGCLALALLMLVPISIKLSDYIYEINQVSIQQEIEDVSGVEEPSETDEDSPWYLKLWNTVTETVQSTVEAAVESGQKALNKFIDAVSVFVIAYCAMPILTALAFVLLIKILFGLNVDTYIDALNPKRLVPKKENKEIVLKENRD